MILYNARLGGRKNKLLNLQLFNRLMEAAGDENWKRVTV